ncbi:MAG: glycine--tRNA ligase subunit beta [Sphingomonas sp.]|nr:glycine--tRNA ligase subunit beta [Sphingomonas sp.]
MTVAAWENAAGAVLTGNAFFEDLAASVANDGDRETAARWPLGRIVDYRRTAYQEESPLAAFDFAVWDIEALVRWWPLCCRAAQFCPIAAEHVLPALARFLVDRLPVVWDTGPCRTRAPENDVTLALAAADRADTLVCMFAAQLKPNGSKDPFALRRAAKEFLQLILPSVTPFSCATTDRAA